MDLFANWARDAMSVVARRIGTNLRDTHPVRRFRGEWILHHRALWLGRQAPLPPPPAKVFDLGTKPGGIRYPFRRDVQLLFLLLGLLAWATTFL